MAHRSYSGPPEAFSPPFSPLFPWIHGLFPAIEFAVAPSPSLPNSGDLTTAERSGAACSRLFPPGLIPPSDSDRTAQITDNASRTHALTPWPAYQRPNPLALGPLG
jgi:hypothetical protein